MAITSECVFKKTGKPESGGRASSKTAAHHTSDEYEMDAVHETVRTW